MQNHRLGIKFMFSKKATKIGEIFTVDSTLCIKCQINGEYLSIFLAFSENMNFTKVTEFEQIKYPKIPHNLFGRSAQLARIFEIFKKISLGFRSP